MWLYLLCCAILFFFSASTFFWVWKNRNNSLQYSVNRLKFNNIVFNVINKMESMFESYLGVSGLGEGSLEPDDIPKTNDPVWILGKKYSAIQGVLLFFK